jgi:dephospho-CoA kinase
MLIVCGPSGAGKSTLGRMVTSPEIVVFEGSVAVADLFRENKLPSEDIIDFCRRWFRERGGDVFAKENIRRITNNGIDLERTIFIGCRAAEEVYYLKQHSNRARAIGVYADASLRFQRCLDRNRSDRLETLTDFIKRDMRELEMGLANLLVHATDQLVINNATRAEFEAVASKIIQDHFSGEYLK